MENNVFSSLSRSPTNLKPIFSSSWQKTDSKKQGGQINFKNIGDPDNQNEKISFFSHLHAI